MLIGLHDQMQRRDALRPVEPAWGDLPAVLAVREPLEHSLGLELLHCERVPVQDEAHFPILFARDELNDELVAVEVQLIDAVSDL